MEPKISTDDQLWGALRPLLARLQALAETDEAVRAELRQLGNVLLALATPTPTSAPASPITPSPITPSPPATTIPVASPIAAPDQPAPAEQSAPPAATGTTPEQTAQPQATVAPSLPAPSLPAPSSPTAVQTTKVRGTPAHRAAATARPQGAQNAYLRPVQLKVAEDTEQTRQAANADLENIATSCALKADAARWMGERQRLLALGKPLPAALLAQKWKLIEHAQTLPECYLWMLHQALPTTTDPILYADLGNAYEACALIAALLEKLAGHEQQTQPFLIQALGVAAIIQATLRNAIQAIEETVDGDQRKLYHWVEAAHAQHHLQMRRYTRRSKEANPRQAGALIQQVQELFNKLSAQRKRQNTQRRLWRTARSLAEQMQAAPDAVSATQAQALIEAINALVAAGIPPSSVELRNLLLPRLDQLSELLPEISEQFLNFTLVLREVERFLDQEPVETTSGLAPAASAEVLQARALLQGQSVVFIGGERRLAAEEALRNAFALHELIWLEGHDQTYTAFEPYVARADVSVVILALRWSRHGFGQVKEYCDHYDKLFVRLVSGYNPNQVAHVLLKQIGARLEQRAGQSTGRATFGMVE